MLALMAVMTSTMRAMKKEWDIILKVIWVSRSDEELLEQWDFDTRSTVAIGLDEQTALRCVLI